MANWLTGIGYGFSIVSVGLLAWVAWPKAGGEPLLAPVVMVGAALSVIGMALRWRAHILMDRKVDEDGED